MSGRRKKVCFISNGRKVEFRANYTRSSPCNGEKRRQIRSDLGLPPRAPRAAPAAAPAAPPAAPAGPQSLSARRRPRDAQGHFLPMNSPAGVEKKKRKKRMTEAEQLAANTNAFNGRGRTRK